MKTFRLISLQIVSSQQVLLPVELEDGLIINKEDEKNRWLIDAFISKDTFKDIEKELNPGNQIFVLAVISKKENEPVLYQTTICSIVEIDGKVIFLLEGTIKRSRNKYAEVLLADLLSEGLEGDRLLGEFKQKIRSKPALSAIKD
ncbi:YwpF family protein [Peribacillus kribbensis]|uniref:YwpF family protein n=1 Tax=Peribacillus kribbensis TaxID=356658 RepID=UPI0004150236|nr:YwpF family protein [Peribacillus kribbensis]